MKNDISIFFSLNNNYMMTTYAAIVSMLRSANSTTFYKVFLLIPNNFDKQNIQKMHDLEHIFDNFSIEIVDMGTQFQDCHEVGHITIQAYYRLVIADLFPQMDRCIYLDGDVLIKGDLWELYNDFDHGCYFSAVKAAGFYLCSKEQQKYICETIGLDVIDNYINSGVLVLNLKKMRDDKISDLLVQTIEKQLPGSDQDALNIVCLNKIHLLPFKYNVHAYFVNNDRIKEVFPIEEVIEARNNPVIIHYAGHITKPWKDKEIIYVKEWWDIVSNAGFDISAVEAAEAKNCFRKYSYFQSRSAGYRDIIVYGRLEDALEVGKQLIEKGECRKCSYYATMDDLEIKKKNSDTFYVVIFQEKYEDILKRLTKNGVDKRSIYTYIRHDREYIYCLEKIYQKDYLY